MLKTLIVAAACAVCASAALADPPPGKGRGHGGPAVRETDSSAVEIGLSVVFTAAERATIGQYFEQHRYGMQPLPPGIAKNVARGKPLPPGIAKKALPGDLAAALPRRAGYDYVVAGSDVLLVEVATNVVTDVLRGVVR
ncbi:MAG: anti-virulence regulator CigR family protein [Gemmatimonas sp.]